MPQPVRADPLHPFEARVFGNLLADATGAPIEGARVELYGRSGVSVTDEYVDTLEVRMPCGSGVVPSTH